MTTLIKSRREVGAAKPARIDLYLQGAMDSAFAEIVNPGEQTRLNERVRVSKIALARYSEPKEQPEFDDTNAPTPERVAGRGSFDAGDNRRGWYVVSGVEGMLRRGQIDLEHVAAAKAFYKNFHDGMRQGGLTARYGERAGSGGTPEKQRSVQYTTGADGRAVEAMGPDDRRTNAHNAWRDACAAIGYVRCRVTGKQEPSAALYHAQRFIAENFELQLEKAPTLADIGRAFIGAKSDQQAQAAGVALIKMVLERLIVHYGI